MVCKPILLRLYYNLFTLLMVIYFSIRYGELIFAKNIEYIIVIINLKVNSQFRHT